MSMSSHLRSLRPAAPSPQTSPDSTPAASLVQVRDKRTNVSSACQPCRKARRKCDGGSPCTQCVGASHECLYRTDLRTRKYRQTLVAERNERATELDTLLHAIRTSSEWEVFEILRSLRSGTDVSTALKSVKGGVVQPAAIFQQHFDKVYDIPQSKEPPAVLSLYGLLQPFDQATSFLGSTEPTSVQWTTVIQDPKVISHLLELYFTYHHPIYPIIPEPLLRADMASGRMRYCSHMLINAVLAVGCTFLGLQDDVKSGNDPWPSVDAFSNEAQRLLSEHPEPSLTAVAALCLLAMVENLHLRFQRARGFSGRASCMALFLGLHLGRASEKEHTIPEADELTLSAVQQQLFWVCFQVDQIASNNAGHSPQIIVDNLEIGFSSADTIAGTGPWAASFTPSPFLDYRDCSGLWVYLADLAKIVHMTQLQPRSFIDGQKSIDIRYWEFRYQAWYSRLPAEFAITDTAPAHVIAIHMWYQNCLIQSFRQISADRADLSITAVQICQNAAKTITDLVSRYRSLYGLKGTNSLMCQAMLDAYRIHLGYFPSTIKDLLTVVEAFQELSKRQHWARMWLKRLESQTQHSPVAGSTAIVEALFGRHEYTSEAVTVQGCSSDLALEVNSTHATINNDLSAGDGPPAAEKPTTIRTQHWKEDYFFSPFVRP